jgi:hypothetical protein
MATQKTTSEIRALLINAKLDFESVVNMALNEYLPKNISKLLIYRRAMHNKAVWNVRSAKIAQINETHWRS